MGEVYQVCTGPSYKGNDLLEVWNQANKRCGALATVYRPWGWRCEVCAQHEDDARKSAGTLGSFLVELFAKSGKRT